MYDAQLFLIQCFLCTTASRIDIRHFEMNTIDLDCEIQTQPDEMQKHYAAFWRYNSNGWFASLPLSLIHIVSCTWYLHHNLMFSYFMWCFRLHSTITNRQTHDVYFFILSGMRDSILCLICWQHWCDSNACFHAVVNKPSHNIYYIAFTSTDQLFCLHCRHANSVQ